MDRLVRLDISGSDGVDNDSLRILSALKSLEELDIDQTRVTDGVAESLLFCKDTLRVLDLSLTRVGDKTVKRLVNDFSGIEVLHLDDTRVTDRALPALKSLKRLRELSAGFYPTPTITGAGVAHLSQLPALRKLILVGHGIDHRVLPALAKAPSLEEVHFLLSRITVSDGNKLRFWRPDLRVQGDDWPGSQPVDTQNQPYGSNDIRYKRGTITYLLARIRAMVELRYWNVVGAPPQLDRVRQRTFAGDPYNTGVVDSSIVFPVEYWPRPEIVNRLLTRLRIDANFPPRLRRACLLAATDDDLEDVQCHPDLETLWISGFADTESNVSDKGLLSLRHTPRLKELRVLDQPITDVGAAAALSRIRSLEKLDLSDTSITDIRLLGALPRLEELIVQETQTRIRVPLLGQFPTLKRLNLDFCPVDDTDVTHVSQIPFLEELHIENTQVRGETVPWAQFTRLRGLWLDGCPISNSAMKGVALLPKLEELHIFSTDVRAPGIRHLVSCKSLRRLSIDGKFTDADIPALTSLTQLAELHLETTEMSKIGQDTLARECKRLGIKLNPL